MPGLLFVAIFVAMMMEIISRALTRTSFAWNTEFCRYALVWVTFLGAVYVRRERSHIQVIFLHRHLTDKNHRIPLFIVNFIRLAAAVAFWAFLAYFGYRLSVRTTRFYSSAMKVSQYWLYFSTVICGVFAGIMEIINFGRLFMGKEVDPPSAMPASGVDGEVEGGI